MSNEDTFKQLILENAVKYKGKADKSFIFGAVLSKFPEYKTKQQELHEILDKLVAEINVTPLETQISQLKAINPSFFDKKEKEDRNIFAFLHIKPGDRVVTCFPPGPEKYPHIGHAKAVILNYLLAKQYGGEFYLRFEDTNPKLVKAEFYEIMQEDFKWLGVEWSKVEYASDYIDKLKEFAEKLIKEDKAYVCFCDSEKMSSLREKKEACECRITTPKKNLQLFKEMEGYPEGKASLRLKIDLSHKNTRMRDPTIFRVIDAVHPRIGKKYRNYPTYDFQNAVLDGYFKTTHRLRTVEFEMASELHHYIRKALGLYDTYTYEFARMNMEGMLSSGRVIREKIDSGELIGWDDPSLPTLRALKRRGFTPEAIKQMVIESGITKSSGSTLTWDTIIKYNKRILNDTSKRFFFIKDPVILEVKGDINKEFDLEMHPSLSLGKRDFISTGSYYLEKEDSDSLKEGTLVRLMDNINFIYDSKTKSGNFHSENYLKFKEYTEEKKIIHYLPVDDKQLAKTTIFMPDHKVLTGIAEDNIDTLEIGEIIQFERFGFCRLDSITKDKETAKKIYNFWFTH